MKRLVKLFGFIFMFVAFSSMLRTYAFADSSTASDFYKKVELLDKEYEDGVERHSDLYGPNNKKGGNSFTCTIDVPRKSYISVEYDDFYRDAEDFTFEISIPETDIKWTINAKDESDKEIIDKGIYTVEVICTYADSEYYPWQPSRICLHTENVDSLLKDVKIKPRYDSTDISNFVGVVTDIEYDVDVPGWIDMGIRDRMDYTYKFKHTYSSSKPSVATINSSGLITPVGLGETTIMVECEGKVATCKFTVTSSSFCQWEGGTIPLKKITKNMKDAKKAKWSLKNNKIATLTKDGKIVCYKEGSVQLIRKVGKKKTVYTVYVHNKKKAKQLLEKGIKKEMLDPKSYSMNEIEYLKDVRAYNSIACAIDYSGHNAYGGYARTTNVIEYKNGDYNLYSTYDFEGME